MPVEASIQKPVATQSSPPGNRRRALLLSYHFPPDASVGSLRWQKMAHHFYQHGWILSVVSLDPNSLERRDLAGLENLPPETSIHHVPKSSLRAATLPLRILKRIKSGLRKNISSSGDHANSTKGASSKGVWESVHRDDVTWFSGGSRQLLRAYTAALDYAQYGAWAKYAKKIGSQILREQKHDLIITAGPPHMIHEAGRALAQAFHLPHVVDMRDPWSLVQRLPDNCASPLWLKLADHYESRAISQASLVVTNSELAQAALAAKYPSAASRVITIMNGVDDEALPNPTRTNRFTLAFAGTIYLDRSPRNVFRAVAEVVRKRDLSPQEFGIEMIGQVASFGGRSLESIALEEKLPSGFLTIGQPRLRKEALEFMAGATMLLSLPQDSTMAIPAKIFEYLQFNAWLLILTDLNSATARLLRNTDADVVDPEDVGSLVHAIETRYQQFVAGERPRAINADGRFSRHVQAERLLNAIREVVVR